MKQAMREKYRSETNTTHKTAMRQGSMRVYKDKLIELRDMVEKHKTKQRQNMELPNMEKLAVLLIS